MSEFSQVIRWNTAFIRGLAEAVLDRAKAVRSSLPRTMKGSPLEASASQSSSTKPKKAKAKSRPKTAVKTARKPRSRAARKTNG